MNADMWIWIKWYGVFVLVVCAAAYLFYLFLLLIIVIIEKLLGRPL